MKMRVKPVGVAMLLTFLAFSLNSARAGWLDWLKKTPAPAEKPAEPQVQPPAPSLTQDEMIRGLKEALSKGTQNAISALGREGGFMDNQQLRIPMPESLSGVSQTLRMLGQDRLVDGFVTSMNRAAEQAVPEAASVFADAISQMTVEDATGIIKGPENAATQYFRRASEVPLREKMLPIVQQATAQAGVTGAYKNLMGGVGPHLLFMDQQAVDVDSYVTDKALDGLFKTIAAEEKRIRENPLARTTDLLQKVFGSAFGN